MYFTRLLIFASALAETIFSVATVFINARYCQKVQNGKECSFASRSSLHKKINIIIRHNLQKKLFCTKKLEFIQILEYSIDV